MKNKKALVVLSGGQDSVTVLLHAIKVHGADNVMAVSFIYGQRHAVPEMKCAGKVCSDFGIVHLMQPVPMIDTSSALTNQRGNVNDPHSQVEGLPASFVWGRNMLFLVYAFQYAMSYNAPTIYLGVCETDYSGYPDCRSAFIDEMERVFKIGYEQDIEIKTPLMYLSKAETFKMAADMGHLDVIIQDTHTCYNGDHETLHAWGYGCGECPACKLRAAGWDNFINSLDADIEQKETP